MTRSLDPSLIFKGAALTLAMVLCTPATADIDLGDQQAIAQSYAIFGQPGANLTSATAIIDYIASSPVLGAEVEQNNIDLSTKVHSLDATSYSLLESGILPLRSNSTSSEVIVTVPMISSDGLSCLPVFQSAFDSDSGVTAFFSAKLMDGTSAVAQYVVKNDLTNGTDLTSSGVSQTCPSSGIGDGSLTFDIAQTKTSTYDLIFDIGYEYDGARRVRNAAIEVYGDDGEPFTGTYTFTLDVTLSVDGSGGDNGGGNGGDNGGDNGGGNGNNGGGPCTGNCGVGVGNGGGNGTGNEGNGQGPN